MESFEFTRPCGCLFKGNSWTIKNAKANIVIFEGMEEHISRYNDFALFLNDYGYSVYGIDTFGQGENVNKDLSNLGVWPVDGFNKQVQIYHELISKLNNDTKLPTYIFAHSMGAYMGQSFLENYPNDVSKICLCGSGGNNKALGLGYLISKIVVHKSNIDKDASILARLMFGGFNKRVTNLRTQYDWLSYNNENVDKYITDPLCGFGPKNRFCCEFIKGLLPLYKKENLAKINTKTHIFLISGQDDPVTNYGKYTVDLTDMYKDLGVANVSHKIYQNMRHEILNEKEWKIVAEDIKNFYE